MSGKHLLLFVAYYYWMKEKTRYVINSNTRAEMKYNMRNFGLLSLYLKLNFRFLNIFLYNLQYKDNKFRQYVFVL